MKPSAGPLRVETLAEWKSCRVEGVELTAEDRRLVARVTGQGDARLSIEEVPGGLRVSARSWVGVLRFSSFELQVVPKLAGDNLGLVGLIDFASGLDCLDRHPSVRSLGSGGTSLLDLIALLLTEACERLARAGLLADYRAVEEDLPVVRGRLLAERQVLQRFGRVDRLECRYDEQTANIPENQILLGAITACARRVRHSGVNSRARRMMSLLLEACSLDEVDLRTVRSTLVYHRLNEPYREAHDLAWLLLDGLGIEDLFDGGNERCFAFLLDMNRLFEEFVFRWVSHLLRRTSLQAVAQRRDRTILWDADRDKPYKTIRPDIVIQQRGRPGKLLPIDAKYKLYDGRNLDAGDVYQLFLYAFAYRAAPGAGLPTALLLYPASQTSASSTRLHVRNSTGAPGAELCTLSIHIPTALAEATTGREGPVGQMLSGRIHSTFAR